MCPRPNSLRTSSQARPEGRRVRERSNVESMQPSNTPPKAKIRALDDRKLGRVEVERIRDMWELRCNRALRKARMSEGVNRGSLKAQGIDRPATKHLGSKASAMSRNGCLLQKAEINQLVSSTRAAWRKSTTNSKNHANRKTRKQSAQRQISAATKSNLAGTDNSRRSKSKRQTYRGGSAWKTVRSPSRKSTSCKSF